MRTVFGYRNLSYYDKCEECGQRMPVGPYSVFAGLGAYLHTTCPSCGSRQLVNEPEVAWALEHGATVTELRELAETPDEVRTMRHRVKRRTRDAVDVECRVGGDVVCPGCDKPLWLPPDLQDRVAAVAHCHDCNQDVHLLPPPRWLLAYAPAMTHVLTVEPLAEFPCPRCQAPIHALRAPLEIRCNSCRKIVGVPESANIKALDPDAARPFYARLRLSAAAVRKANPPVGVYIGSMLLLLGGTIIGVSVASMQDIGYSAIVGASFAGAVTAAISIPFIALSLRNRRQTRAYADQLARAEQERVPAEPPDGPYR